MPGLRTKTEPLKRGEAEKRANERDPTHMQSYYNIPIILHASPKCTEK